MAATSESLDWKAVTYNSFKILFTILALAISSLIWFGEASAWWLILLFILGISILAYGSTTIQSNFFVPSIYKLKGKSELALTFDDGPHPNTTAILETLKKYQAPATFFCIGKQARQHSEILNQIIADGHIVGNHTQNHSNKWGFMKTAQLKMEIEECSKTLQDITGREVKFFRPPFGVTNPKIGRALSQLPLKIIGWDLRSLDTTIKDPKKLWARVKPKLANSSILLFHDTQEHTTDVLEKTLEYCKSHGIKIVSLGEKLEENTHA